MSVMFCMDAQFRSKGCGGRETPAPSVVSSSQHLRSSGPKQAFICHKKCCSSKVDDSVITLTETVLGTGGRCHLRAQRRLSAKAGEPARASQSLVHPATKITPSLILLSLPLLTAVAPEDPFTLETAGVVLGASGMPRKSSLSGDLGPTPATILTSADTSVRASCLSVCARSIGMVSVTNQKPTGKTKHYLLVFNVQQFVLTLFIRCLSSYRTHRVLV